MVSIRAAVCSSPSSLAGLLCVHNTDRLSLLQGNTVGCPGVAGALCWTHGRQQALASPRKARLTRDGEMLGRGAALRLEARTVGPTAESGPHRPRPSPWSQAAGFLRGSSSWTLISEDQALSLDPRAGAVIFLCSGLPRPLAAAVASRPLSLWSWHFRVPGTVLFTRGPAWPVAPKAHVQVQSDSSEIPSHFRCSYS